MNEQEFKEFAIAVGVPLRMFNPLGEESALAGAEVTLGQWESQRRRELTELVYQPIVDKMVTDGILPPGSKVVAEGPVQ